MRIHSKLPLSDTLNTPAGCVGCPVRQSGICHVLSVEELSLLARISTRRVVAQHDTVWRTRDDLGFVAVVLSGTVSLSLYLPDGRHQIVALQFPLSIIGAIAGGTGLEIVAEETTRICSFPRSHFENVLSRNREMELEFRDQIGVQLDEARNWLLTVGRKTARERVATYLDQLSRGARSIDVSEEHRGLRLPLSRGAMADFLGLTIETVSRRMADLKREGIVDFHDASFAQILSPARLASATGNHLLGEPAKFSRHQPADNQPLTSTPSESA
ncbi:Crp/Fnr family transcriptional regulator [Aureimonas sp. Leaf324]|uniref:Crp/Fnr family transcriptional regulator n=1 Tax=Aureimonas sp. Leaf324 TaxID=1736336 RepID=UPI0009E8C025|nr:Crp/Fnr family transcriptional regulator [Aureimonas sp. Leaf324]